MVYKTEPGIGIQYSTTESNRNRLIDLLGAFLYCEETVAKRELQQHNCRAAISHFSFASMRGEWPYSESET